MMGSLSLTSTTPITSKRMVRFQNKNYNPCLVKSSSLVVNCQNGETAIKGTSGVSSSVVKQTTSDHGTPAFKDLMPNGASNSSIADRNDEDGIGIVKFLKHRGFFITGATGFLAKVLIEKILRTMPDVSKIYLLIKAKNSDAAMDRLKNEIINTELFKCLQQTYGSSYQAFMLSKLVPVVGNVCETNLGLDEQMAKMIAEDVDIIVNSAANTTFDERYDVALDINTGGPKRLMSFAKKCHNLKLFVHVSTAYVNGQRQGRIMEKPFCIGDSIARENHVYGTPKLNVEEEIKLVMESKQALGANAAQKMKELGLERAKKYGWQDTYVFTKAIGEMMIDSMRGEVPVVIIRPSVIESTYKEPFPGWIEGNRMMDPIVLAYGKGQLSAFLLDPNGVLDVVPADMVVNATLAAMAKHGGVRKSEGDYIYQIASSVVNPLEFQDLADAFYEHFNSSPVADSKGRPIHVSPMKLYKSMQDLSSHLWRDVIQRSGLGTTDSPNRELSHKLENKCRKSVEQVMYLANIYEAYSFYGGRFDNSNTERLMELMSKEEKRTFGFDVGKIDWKDYITNVHIPGLRKHVMKGRGKCS